MRAQFNYLRILELSRFWPELRPQNGLLRRTLKVSSELTFEVNAKHPFTGRSSAIEKGKCEEYRGFKAIRGVLNCALNFKRTTHGLARH